MPADLSVSIDPNLARAVANAIAKERERCIRIVLDRIVAARLGDLDADLRSIARHIDYYIRAGVSPEDARNG